MEIDMQGLDALLKKLDRMGGDANMALLKGTQKSTQLVQGTAKLLCPVDTGNLRVSIERRTEVEAQGCTGIVGTNSDHWAYVEFGTGPKGEGTYEYRDDLHYTMEPWVAHIEGVGFRTLEGYPARPFLYPALADNRDNIQEIYRQTVQDAIQGRSANK